VPGESAGETAGRRSARQGVYTPPLPGRNPLYRLSRQGHAARRYQHADTHRKGAKGAKGRKEGQSTRILRIERMDADLLSPGTRRPPKPPGQARSSGLSRNGRGLRIFRTVQICAISAICVPVRKTSRRSRRLRPADFSSPSALSASSAVNPSGGRRGVCRAPGGQRPRLRGPSTTGSERGRRARRCRRRPCPSGGGARGTRSPGGPGGRTSW
jgi:hypothetical protein